MNDSLKDTLLNLLASNASANPALNILIDDYTSYHWVFVGIGSIIVLIFMALSITFFRRLRRGLQNRPLRWAIEDKLNASLLAVSVLAGIVMALLVGANASNALNPRHGFALVVDTLDTTVADGGRQTLLHAFDTWLLADGAEMPPPVRHAISERLSWQRPKAAICSLLFLCFALLTVWAWRALFQQIRASNGSLSLGDKALLASGSGTATLAMLLMVMALANMQAAFAPITLTLMFSR